MVLKYLAVVFGQLEELLLAVKFFENGIVPNSVRVLDAHFISQSNLLPLFWKRDLFMVEPTAVPAQILSFSL